MCTTIDKLSGFESQVYFNGHIAGPFCPASEEQEIKQLPAVVFFGWKKLGSGIVVFGLEWVQIIEVSSCSRTVMLSMHVKRFQRCRTAWVNSGFLFSRLL